MFSCIEDPSKNWKVALGDVRERELWDDDMRAYEEMLSSTSTHCAPWYVIPADRKWFTRAAVADVIVSKLESLNLRYPELSDQQKQDLLIAKEMLERE
ncbi:MAG TPA: hypothetical protein VNL69_04140 [Bacteroidota bacterium]|nr:hypothetical protein [Bacteroidota bacterium]